MVGKLNIRKSKKPTGRKKRKWLYVKKFTLQPAATKKAVYTKVAVTANTIHKI